MQEVEDTNNKLVDVIKLEDDLITIDKTQYKIVENHDDGFNKERIEERYNNVLEKYDYIVGDWGYDQLRFKGFYEDERKESNLENRISHLEDYLLEYCNFGCAYFVLEKVKKDPIKKVSHRRSNRTNNRTNNHTNKKTNHKFKTRMNHAKPGVKKSEKPTKSHSNNHSNQKKKNKVTKRHVNNKKKTTTHSTKKAFKIRKIGEKNK